jgi:hypothetical protein
MKTKVLRLTLLHRISTRGLFFCMAAVLLLVFASYFYLVNKTIMNVVAREKTERTIAQLSGTIGELEFKYITLKNGVTLDLAHAKGFQDASPTKFLARNDTGTTITYNYSR